MGNKGSSLYPEPDGGFRDLKAERATRCEGLSLLAITREDSRGQRRSAKHSMCCSGKACCVLCAVGMSSS